MSINSVKISPNLYERYETMYSQDSLLEILPELGVCNDKEEDLRVGLNKILWVIRLQHIWLSGETLRSRRYYFKRPSRLTADYMSNSADHLETLLLVTSKKPYGIYSGYFLSSLCKDIYRHFEHGRILLAQGGDIYALYLKKSGSYWYKCWEKDYRTHESIDDIILGEPKRKYQIGKYS